jgi:hypothetical protein
MRDIEAKEGAASECCCLRYREDSDVEEPMEMCSITTTDSSDTRVAVTRGNTVLHEAVLSAYKSGKADGDFCSSIDRLMSHHTEVNMPNKDGYTAIGLAVELHGKEDR